MKKSSPFSKTSSKKDLIDRRTVDTDALSMRKNNYLIY